MKKIFTFIQIFLLPYTVFGADADEGKAVSVMEGDSVTLIPNQDVQGIILVQWRFGGPTIAQISGKRISYPEYTKIFTDRLKLNETGSLTIINMRHKHSGRYELVIDHSEGKLEMNFDVTISEPPLVIEAFKAERKSLTVTEGDPVILHTDITKLQGHELIVWRFGDEGKLLAKEDKETKSSPYYNTDERFKGRLQLNDQTGSLTINNMKDTDAGLYTVKINSNEQTTYKRFTVIVIGSGLSSDVVIGIVVVVLLLFGVAAGSGIVYHRRKISELKENIYVTAEGEDVTIKNETKLHKGDKIEWWFHTELIAFSMDRKTETYGGPNDLFRDRLELDETGSLTIKNISLEHFGEFKLEIIDSKEKTTMKTFTVCGKETEIKVLEEETTYLSPETRIQRDDEIQWLFGDKKVLIAKMTGEPREITYPGERFRDRLELDKETGTLTIRNITFKHTGDFKVKISSSRRTTIIEKFIVYIPRKMMILMFGDEAVLDSGAEIEREDHVEWKFKTYESPIAEIKEGQKNFLYAGPGERFRDTLDLHKKTGSLIIKNGGPEHTGHYYLLIKNSTGAQIREFSVVYLPPEKKRVEGLESEASSLLQEDGQNAVYANDRTSPV